jgi:hypothetical protein
MDFDEHKMSHDDLLGAVQYCICMFNVRVYSIVFNPGTKKYGKLFKVVKLKVTAYRKYCLQLASLKL